MWCPKCKTEYNEGITVCADCGTELVEKPETADFINVCEINDEETADEILEFLSYSKVNGAVKERAEDAKGFQILLPENMAKKAEKMVHGYLIGKEEEKQERKLQEGTEENEDFSDDEPDDTREEELPSENPLFVDKVDEDSVDLLYASEKSEYVKKADKYNDMKFSGLTFVIFGVLGGIYLLLTKLAVIPISYNIYVFCVLAALFLGFIISGAVSFFKAKGIKKQIPAEEQKIEEINAWLRDHVTDGMLKEWTDSSVSASENDLLLIAHIQLLLKKQFPEEEKTFLEMLADEYYEETVLSDEK